MFLREVPQAEGIRTGQGCVMRDSNFHQILTKITYTENMLIIAKKIATEYAVKEAFLKKAQAFFGKNN